MANYIFETPTVSEGPIGGHRLFYFRKRNVSVSVYKTGNTYATTRYVQDSFKEDFDEYYTGGYNHIVDDETKAALIAANIGITEANFTAQ
jgi:hypothetical protein